MTDQPWHDLPPVIAEVLRPVLDDVALEIIGAVADVPAYARPIEGPFGEGVRTGVQEALRHFLAEIEAGGPVDRRDVYRWLGRGEMRAGRSLDSLLSAYRIGARVAWRRFAATGEAAGLPPQTLYRLAEALFAYIDMLSAESAEGHAFEQSAAAGESELWRRRVVRLLLREPPAEPESVLAAAASARWDLPRMLAVLVVGGGAGGRSPTGFVDRERDRGERDRGGRDGGEPGGGEPGGGEPGGGGGSDAGEHRGLAPLRARLPAATISDVVGDLLCVVVPDPDAPGRRADLTRAVKHLQVSAALGTTVSWPDAALSFARARAALELGAPGELVVARERAGELLLAGSPALAREFAVDRLSPLDGESASSRERLTETLRAWLAEQGRLTPVARRLGVHPQTARYRIGRLRELFGGALDDADERFWLALALRLDARS